MTTYTLFYEGRGIAREVPLPWTTLYDIVEYYGNHQDSVPAECLLVDVSM